MKYVWILPLILIGCDFAPCYRRPQMAIPSDYRFENSPASTLCNVRWWEELGDQELNKLIETALANNQDLQVAIWRVCEFYEQFVVVRSALFPDLSVSGFASKERVSPRSNFLAPGISPTTPLYDLNLSVSYELDFWGALRNATKESYYQYLAQVENRKTVVLTLVASVAQSYILLRQLDLQLEIAKKTLQTRKEALDFATARFEGGLTSEIEVEQAISVYQENLAYLNEYEKLVPQTENLISLLLGQSSASIPRGVPIEEFHLPESIPVGAPLDLLTRRPDIMACENNLIAAYANVGVARAAFLPTTNFDFLYGRESVMLKNFFSSANKIWAIGGSFVEQVFTGGRLIGQLGVAEAQKKELLHTYQQTILNALREVNDSLIGLEKNKEIVLVYKRDVDALKEYLKLAWLRYYEGQADYLTVLDAERHLFESELALAKSIGLQYISLVNLYKAVGGGWVTEADCTALQGEGKCTK